LCKPLELLAGPPAEGLAADARTAGVLIDHLKRRVARGPIDVIVSNEHQFD
jgi:hypothetical protein